MVLQPGDLAPDFCLTDAQGEEVRLAQQRGQWVVVYFYPRDNTPGCTKEACGFRDAFAAYQDRHVVILGVSTDDGKSHRKFIEKYQLPFPLLCDPGGEVAAAYGSYGLKKFMGKESMGVFRHTFVINPEGRIAKIYPKVKSETHAAEILEDLEGLEGFPHPPVPIQVPQETES